MDTLFVDNTGVIELLGLTDEITGELIDDAIVTATLYFCNAEVSGQSWPVTLDHVDDSPEAGNYRGLLESDLDLTTGQTYSAVVTAVSGTITGTWTCNVIAKTRPCT